LAQQVRIPNAPCYFLLNRCDVALQELATIETFPGFRIALGDVAANARLASGEPGETACNCLFACLGGHVVGIGAGCRFSRANKSGVSSVPFGLFVSFPIQANLFRVVLFPLTSSFSFALGIGRSTFAMILGRTYAATPVTDLTFCEVAVSAFFAGEKPLESLRPRFGTRDNPISHWLLPHSS